MEQMEQVEPMVQVELMEPMVQVVQVEQVLVVEVELLTFLIIQ